MGSPILWTIVGLLLTMATLIASVLYRVGHMAARLEELERWRASVRQDLHEVSDRLEEQTNAIERLTTLIEERTDRRTTTRVPIT